MDVNDVPPDDVYDMPKHDRKMRTNTHTKKYTPPRFQKGKYRHLKQGVRRGTTVNRRKPVRQPRKRRYNKRITLKVPTWDSEHVWRPSVGLRLWLYF